MSVLKKLLELDHLTRDEQDKLFEEFAVTKDEKIATKIVLAYSKFIVKLVYTKYHRMQLDLEDLVHEGIIALYLAVKTYNKDKKLAFINYAKYYIFDSITDYMYYNKHPVTMPSTFGYKSIHNILKHSKQEFTEDEILELSKKYTRDLDLITLKRFNGHIEDITDSELFNDTIYTSNNMETQLHKHELKNIINDVIKNNLTEKEQKIIYYHYFEELPSETIGPLFNVTGNAIRIKLKKIIQKLKFNILKRINYNKLNLIVEDIDDEIKFNI